MTDRMQASLPPTAKGTIVKRPTGIAGFDEISEGGLPAGRLVGLIGGPGAGKTVFALQTLVNRAQAANDSGIFVSFEESPENLRANAGEFAWHFASLDGTRIFFVDGRLSPDTMLSGNFDLTGLLAQLAALIAQTGASTVVFDGLDILLANLAEIGLERRELLRIEQWIQDQAISCIMTGKLSAGSPRELMRQDYLHYITDVVVELEGRMYESAFTRLIRIVKYRGSSFAGNAFPAVITGAGFEVIAKTRARLNYPVFADRLTSGVPDIDALLGGGYRRGTATLVSGAPGTAKTSLAGSFALASCQGGETVVYVSFDESDSQIVYDLQTIGIDLEPHRTAGRLVIVSLRAASVSPDRHFVEMRRLLDEHRPSVFIIDPITALIMENYPFAMQVCENLLDEARWRGMTAFCTSLSGVSVNDQELSISNLSTIADTWLHLTYNSRGGERNRAFTIVKSRGTAHSNQVRELLIGNAGLEVVEAYSAEGEVLMGSARVEKEQLARQRILDLEAKLTRQEFELEKSLANLETQFKSVQDQIAWKRREIDLLRQEAATNSEKLRRDAAERQLRRETGRQV